MLILLQTSATSEDVSRVVASVREAGLVPHLRRQGQRTVIVAVGERTTAIASRLHSVACVEAVRPVGKPFALACRDCQPENPVLELANGLVIGGEAVLIVAGPACIEGDEMLLETARAVAAHGAHLLKANVFDTASSPYAFHGPGLAALRWVALVRELTSLPVMSEVRTPGDVEAISAVVDLVQVGSRNMQNFDLLRELGRQPKPVLLKRGAGSTIDEWLLGAEYVLSQGNHRVVLCEAGVRGFDTATDGVLDIAAVPLLRELTHLPVVVDPSEGTGHSSLVPSCARGAIAAGADGIVVEVHPRPHEALAGGLRSLAPHEFAAMMPGLSLSARAAGRSLARRSGQERDLERRPGPSTEPPCAMPAAGTAGNGRPAGAGEL